jgi:hypothetical protein
VTAQQIDHHAFVGRIQMLDEDERHAAVGGQRAQERFAGLEAACGCAYSNDKKVLGGAGRSARRHGTPARSRLGNLGPMRLTFGHARLLSIERAPDERRELLGLTSELLPNERGESGKSEYYHKLYQNKVTISALYFVESPLDSSVVFETVRSIGRIRAFSPKSPKFYCQDSARQCFVDRDDEQLHLWSARKHKSTFVHND